MLARRSLIETPIYYSIGIDALRLGRACGGTVADCASDSVLHSPPPSLGNTRVHLSATYLVSDISQPSFVRTCNSYLLNLFPQGAPTNGLFLFILFLASHDWSLLRLGGDFPHKIS